MILTNKTCRKCNETKPLIDMVKDVSKKHGYANICNNCKNIENKQRRNQHPEWFKNYDKKKYERRKKGLTKSRVFNPDTNYDFKMQFLQSIKALNKCKDCQEDNPACLSFHHRDSKYKLFTVSFISGKSIEQLQEEVSKCDVLCENCHRKLHCSGDFSTRPNYVRVKLRALHDVKRERGCEKCKINDSVCLDFHHRFQKNFTIGENVNLHSLDELLAETRLCDVLCANCHRKQHYTSAFFSQGVS